MVASLISLTFQSNSKLLAIRQNNGLIKSSSFRRLNIQQAGICNKHLKLFVRNLFLPQASILSSPHGQRALSPGRVVTINTAEHKNALAVILQAENVSTQVYSTVQSQLVSSPNEKKFDVLVICDAEEHNSGEVNTQMID